MSKAILSGVFGVLALGLLVVAGLSAEAPAPVVEAEIAPGCEARSFEDIPLIVCAIPASAAGDDLFLVHGKPGGGVYGDFNTLNIWMKKTGRSLQFAMNAGMYHEDRSPVGLYRDRYGETSPLITEESSGNFGMLPNGVFWMHDGRAGVMESVAYSESEACLEDPPNFATQSGPMLVIDGELHPRFMPGSPNVNRRNGVGVSADGETVFAVISDNVINFDTFARFFRDELKTPNALYLDGFVSRLWAADIGRHEKGAEPLGPMLVWAPTYRALREQAEQGAQQE